MDYLSCVELEPRRAARAAVIWLHGLGADGHDFEPIVPELRLPPEAAIRFVFPNAPSIPVTINGGFVMPAWYDIIDTRIDRRVDDVRLRASAQWTRDLIEREIERGIDSRRIIVAGYSQGGAVGYEAALTFSRPLAGLLVLSSYLATRDSIELNPANAQLPIRIYHGTADPIVPEFLGRQSAEWLQERGYDVSYSVYPMAHGLCAEEVAGISAWLQERLL